MFSTFLILSHPFIPSINFAICSGAGSSFRRAVGSFETISYLATPIGEPPFSKDVVHLGKDPAKDLKKGRAALEPGQWAIMNFSSIYCWGCPAYEEKFEKLSEKAGGYFKFMQILISEGEKEEMIQLELFYTLGFLFKQLNPQPAAALFDYILQRAVKQSRPAEGAIDAIETMADALDVKKIRIAVRSLLSVLKADDVENISGCIKTLVKLAEFLTVDEIRQTYNSIKPLADPNRSDFTASDAREALKKLDKMMGTRN